VRKLIAELEEQGVQGIVVDLRNNGGGSLLEATTLTGLFIDKGPVVQVRNRDGRVSLEEDDEPGMAWSGPLVVLVNRYSASASEIFAAAIQDYGRGLVVGEPTFGKGTVQSLLDLADYAPADRTGLGQLKITMAQFFRVNGSSTQRRGVTPDIRFPSAGNPEDYGERSYDNALPWTSIEPARFDPSGDLSRMVTLRGTDAQLNARVEQQLGLKESILARVLGANVISDVALIGRDIFLREGAAIGILFEASSDLLAVDLQSQRERAVRDLADEGATMRTIRIQQRDVSFASTPDHRLRSFYVQDGKYHLVTNCRAIARDEAKPRR